MEPEYAPIAMQRQPLVYLDVGGESFKIAQGTLERYPNSLLYKMTQEFPSLVEKGEPLFVDRNPKSFPWIQEIYRDGDIKNSVPNISRDYLQKELDFYQLPAFEELYKQESFHALAPRETYAETLMTTILREIEASKLQDFFPWTILIYHKIVDGKLDPFQRIYVSPPCPLANAELVKDRGHEEFDSALQMEGDMCPRQTLGERSKLSPSNMNVSFLIWKKGYRFIELLESQVDRYGMILEEAKAATFCLSNGKMVYGHFILDYKSC